MSRGRAYMSGDVAYRARINYKNRAGESAQLVLGPYSTPGAAKGQATAKTNGPYSSMKDPVVTIEKATYWQKI